MSFIQACWQITVELSHWLFLGAFISALIHRFLPAGFLAKRLHGMGGIFRSTLLGVPLPLCSCGVIPAGIGLKKDGSSDSSAIAFLISTPQTGVDSILVSSAFLGWPFAIFKVISAAATGLLGGLLVEKYGGVSVQLDTQGKDETSQQNTWKSAWNHGVQLLRSIWKWLLIGILLSGALSSLLPPDSLALIDNGPLAVFAALFVSIPLYVCATASVPIAATLVASGFPLGAALVFLMAGPATNLATIGAILKSFGKRVTSIYLMTVIVSSILLGVGFDFLLATQDMKHLAANHEHESWWQVAFAVALLASMLFFASEDLLRRYKSMQLASSKALHVPVHGMTCGGCVARLERVLNNHEKTTEVCVTLKPGAATVKGSISKQELLAVIEANGFQSVLEK